MGTGGGLLHQYLALLVPGTVRVQGRVLPVVVDQAVRVGSVTARRLPRDLQDIRERERERVKEKERERRERVSARERASESKRERESACVRACVRACVCL